MRTCKEISKLVSESFDRKLPFRQRMGVQFHLMMCSLCRTYSHQVGQLRSILKGVAKSAPPPEPLPDEARQRIKQALESDKH
ncbi:MAG: zf-HC2 domain-containing protein [Pontiella sp.]